MRNYYSHKIIRHTSCYYFLQWHFFFTVWNYMYYQYILIFSSFHTKRQNCGIFNSCKTRNLQGKPKISCYMYWLHFFKCVWSYEFCHFRDKETLAQYLKAVTIALEQVLVKLILMRITISDWISYTAIYMYVIYFRPRRSWLWLRG